MKIKNLVVTVIFCLFIAVFFLLCIFHTPQASSDSERRPLAQFPSINLSGVLNGNVIEDIEDYTVDQFPFRDSFRKLYTLYRTYVVGLKDTNDLAIRDGYIAKVEGGLNEKSLAHAINRFRYLLDNYVGESGGKVYFALVPDKNYYFSEEYDYISIDYNAMLAALQDALPEAEFIEMFDKLTLADYYKTDTHWSQEKLLPVRDLLLTALGAPVPAEAYTVNTLHPFYGVYHGQAALNLPADTIYYLTGDGLDACTVYDYETDKTVGLYSLEKFDSKEPYDIFLGGTKMLLRIDNPNATTDKELVVFRDSFGSSLLPLMAESYKSIYVVDIRYLASQFVGQYVDFADKDVLFLYSALVLNDSFALK